MTQDEADSAQSWAGMSGSVAFHLIDRHADDWEETEMMMNAWLRANSVKAPRSGVCQIGPPKQIAPTNWRQAEGKKKSSIFHGLILGQKCLEYIS